MKKVLVALTLSATLTACGSKEAVTGPTVDQLTLSQDRTAQSSLRNSIAAAKVCFTDNNTYTGCTDAVLNTIEPSLTFQAGASIESSQVSDLVYTTNASGDSWAAAVMSGSGTCFWINDVSGKGTYYGTGANCTGLSAQEAVGTTW
jgi:predicted small lipoprotein YifL